MSENFKIEWIRTTLEPIPQSIPIQAWFNSLEQGGIVKWFILQILSAQARRKIISKNILTNSRFSGVLFTGRMEGKTLTQSLKELELSLTKDSETRPILLIHPSKLITDKDEKKRLKKFKLSEIFFSSKWRYRELKSLMNIRKVN